MRAKQLLAAVLLGAALCSVPVSLCGDVLVRDESKVSPIEFFLLADRLDYIMLNPTIPLVVDFHYDPDGRYGRSILLPEGVDTTGRIWVWVQDRKGIFSGKTGKALLNQFKTSLEAIYVFIMSEATDMDTDIVAAFYGKEEIPLGYFYQGEYHLWER